MKLHEYLGRPLVIYDGKANPFPTTDLMGIEIELENVDLPRGPGRTPSTVAPPDGWTYHIDDSLRNNGLEFVFDGPVGGSQAAKRLDNLITWIKTNKLDPEASNRTSVHVHLDAGDCTIEQLFKWLLIYVVYEPLLFEVYAPDRKKSNFCVPVYDSFITRQIIGFLKRSFPAFYKELGKYRGQYRYSAVNLDALHKFGSLEFRHLGGTYKPKPIIDWASTLLMLKSWAMNPNTDANEIFHGPSKYYCQQMTSAIFNEELTEKMFNLSNFTDLYLEGARTAQEIFLDEKIPEVPPTLLPRINEIRQQKASKKVEMVKEHVNKLSGPVNLDNIPDYREFLQASQEANVQIPPLNIVREGLWHTEAVSRNPAAAPHRPTAAPRPRPAVPNPADNGGGDVDGGGFVTLTNATTTADWGWARAVDAGVTAERETPEDNAFTRVLQRIEEEDRAERQRLERERLDAQARATLDRIRRRLR